MNWDTLLLIVVPLVGYLVAYHLYGRFLARRIFRLDDARPVPSRELEDGKDYVPARKGIIFGHHYASIAGTGPIVGPAIGISWGWVPALIWVFVGSIVMGGVHDFGSLVISLRNQGKSLSEVASKYINRRVRTIFFLIVFFELWIVIAIFAVIIGALFTLYPQSVFPIWMEIPIAVMLGVMIYKWKRSLAWCTVAAITTMYLTVVAGQWIRLAMPPQVFGVPASGVWTLILLLYAFVASTLGVRTLLEPRDYINAWQLFVAMGLLFAGAIVASVGGQLGIVAPAFSLSPPGAPPLWPFLFVTIACGAISGFHSLVASGTTPKQVAKESDALFVGYGSMLLEGVLALLVLVAVGAGIGMHYEHQVAVPVSAQMAALHQGGGAEAVSDAAGTTAPAGKVKLVKEVLTGRAAWDAHYKSWGDVAGKGLAVKLRSVVVGSANMMSKLHVPTGIGIIIMGVFIASFAGTTLDTATRVQRYVLSEMAKDLRIRPLTNRYVATFVAVGAAAVLAFATGANGTGAMKLWPMFGAVNQLLAALALLVVTIYLRRRTQWGWIVSAVPCAFMIVMTNYAMFLNERNFVQQRHGLLMVVNGLTLLLAGWMTVESVIAFFGTKQQGKPAPGS